MQVILDQECEAVSEILEQSKKYLHNLLKELTVYQKDKLILATDNFYQTEDYQNFIFVLRSGELLWKYNDSLNFIVEAGDIIPPSCFTDLRIGKICSEFAVTCDVYSIDEIYRLTSKDLELFKLWSRYLFTYNTAMTQLNFELMQVTKISEPHIHTFPANTVMIEQGSYGTDVYLLLEGEADVVVDGVKVGQVSADQIFGAFAAFSDGKRTASVVSKCRCLVLILEKEKFMELMRSKPSTVQKMIEDMVKNIVELNETIVQLKSKSQQ